MGKKRDKIKMTEAEIEEFLAQGKSLQLATNGPNGFPHLVAMWYGLIDGKIVIETFAKSQKVVNLRRDPKITVLLESGTTYDQLKGLSIQGEAELLEDEARVHEVMRAVLGRNHPDMDEKTLDTAVEMGAKKRLAVVVHPDKVISWDHTKLGGSY